MTRRFTVDVHNEFVIDQLKHSKNQGQEINKGLENYFFHPYPDVFVLEKDLVDLLKQKIASGDKEYAAFTTTNDLVNEIVRSYIEKNPPPPSYKIKDTDTGLFFIVLIYDNEKIFCNTCKSLKCRHIQQIFTTVELKKKLEIAGHKINWKVNPCE